MAYHLHLNFETKEYFYSEEAWSTKKTLQGLILPISAHGIAADEEVEVAIGQVKVLIDEILDKVDIKWLDWMAQEPTIIYQDNVKSLIYQLEKQFYIKSFLAYANVRKISENNDPGLFELFHSELLNRGYGELNHCGIVIF